MGSAGNCTKLMNLLHFQKINKIQRTSLRILPKFKTIFQESLKHLPKELQVPFPNNTKNCNKFSTNHQTLQEPLQKSSQAQHFSPFKKCLTKKTTDKELIEKQRN